jgi:hypothetical protein
MELLKKLKTSRRFALRGALGGIGVALWLPVLDAMCNDHGTAFAQGAPLPTSFGIWFWGNGIHPEVWTPTATGKGDDWQLSQNLQDFAEVKDAMTLVTGLDMLDGKFKGHGWGVVYVLAGGDGTPCSEMSDIDKTPSHHYETGEATQYQPTVDQTIADAIHTNEPFKSFETGVLPYTGMNMGSVSNNLAHRGPNSFLPPKRDPKLIFNKLTEALQPETMSPSGVPSDISNKMRCSVLDAVLQDANRLKMRLGSADAKRVDEHMDSIRSLEQRIAPKVSGSGGGTGTTTAECPALEMAPMTLEDMTAKSQAINRLIVAALSCNLTRVFTHLWSGARDDNTYPTIPINSDHHSLTHGTVAQNEDAKKIERYVMSQYADLAKVMKDTPMGAGTVLDNTLIYGVSDVAAPQGHLMTNFHIVLMGHAGGKLPGNRHIRLPGRKVTELVLTLQQVMGLNVDTWGSWDQTSKGMSEIMT